MENIVGKWGGIPIKELKNRELDVFVHPNDLENLDKLEQPINLIIDIEGDFIKLKINSSFSIRLKSTIVQETQKPEYFINDKVKTINSKGFLESGIVKDYYWHLKSKKYIYLLEVNGKMKGRRYYAEDLDIDKSN